MQCAARTTFEALSSSNKKWHVLNIEGANAPETRQHWTQKSVAILREGRAR